MKEYSCQSVMVGSVHRIVTITFVCLHLTDGLNWQSVYRGIYARLVEFELE